MLVAARNTYRDHGRAHTGALQGAEGGPDRSSWIYTVGLTHNFGHAELVTVDCDLGQGGALLNELGTRISRGLRVDAGTTLDLGGYVVEFEGVHHRYLAGGLCASWDAYNRGPARDRGASKSFRSCSRCRSGVPTAIDDSVASRALARPASGTLATARRDALNPVAAAANPEDI